MFTPATTNIRAIAVHIIISLVSLSKSYSNDVLKQCIENIPNSVKKPTTLVNLDI